MMRYHVICEGELGAGAWRIESEQNSDQFQINDAKWETDGTFVVIDARRAVPTEVRLRRTWRHRIFELFRGGEMVALVRTSLRSGIRAEFVWEMPGPDMLEVRGDFEDLNYRFVRGARTVGVVSTLQDHDHGFGIEVLRCEEQSLVLAAALAVRSLCAESCGVQRRVPARRSAAVPFESEVRVAG